MPRTVQIDAQAVADVINRRLDELGWSPTDLVEVTGVNATTLRYLRAAEPKGYTPKVLRTVAEQLGFERDAFLTLKAGDPQPPAATPPSEAEMLARRDQAARREQDVRRLAETVGELMRRLEVLEQEHGTGAPGDGPGVRP